MSKPDNTPADKNDTIKPGGSNKLPLLPNALVPGAVHDLDLAPTIREQLRDFLQENVQVYKTRDKQILDSHESCSMGVRHAEVELMQVHASLLHRRDRSGQLQLRSDISQKLAEQHGLIRIRSTYQDTVNRRNARTGLIVKSTGQIALEEHPDPYGCEHLRNGKNFPHTIFSDILTRLDSSKGRKRKIHHHKKEKKIEFAVLPTSITFNKFVVGKSFHARLKVQNISKYSAVFRLVTFKNKVFTISKEAKVMELAPGLSASFTITFNCVDKDDHFENIVILMRGGKKIIVPIRATQEPPCLRTDYFLQTMKPNISFENMKSNTNLIDCERSFVGDTKHLSIPLLNEGPLARFCILSESSWTFKSIGDITKDNVLIVPPFSLSPAFFTLDTNEYMPIDVAFKPICEGSHAERLIVLCDNITVRYIDLIGESIAYRPNFFTFENVEKMFNILIDDDMDAQYCLYLGECFLNKTIEKHFKIDCSSITEMKYFWSAEPCSIEGVNPMPLENITISPVSGVFTQSSKVNFSVNFIARDIPLGRYVIKFTIWIDDLPKAAVHTEPVGTGENSDSNEKITVSLASLEVWVDVIEPIVSVWENYITLTSAPNVLTTREVHFNNYSLRPIRILWPDQEYNGQVSVTPSKGTLPALTGRKFKISFISSTIGLHTIMLRAYLEDSSLFFDIQLEADVKLDIPIDEYKPIDCGIVGVGESCEGGYKLNVSTPTPTSAKIEEYLLTFSDDGSERLMKTKGKIIHDYPKTVYPGEKCAILFMLNTEREQICYNIVSYIVGNEQFMVEILADCQMPDASLASYKYIFDKTMFIGNKETFSMKIRNHSLLPAKYKLKGAFGPDLELCSLLYSKQSGIIPPNSHQNIIISLIPKSPGFVHDLYIPCFIEGMTYPLIARVFARIKGKEVSFSWPSEDGGLVTIVWPEEECNVQRPLVPSDEHSESKSDSCVCHTDDSFTSVTSSCSEKIEYDIMHYADSSESSVPYENWPIIGGKYYGASFTSSLENLKKDFECPWTSETLNEKYKKIENKEGEIQLLSKRAIRFKIKAFQEYKKTFEISNSSPETCHFRTKVHFFRAKKYVKKLDPFQEAEIRVYCYDDSDVDPPELCRMKWMKKIKDNLGLGISTKEKGLLRGFESVSIEVSVFGVAWGIYFDTISISIDDLPDFHIPVLVEVIENPAYFTFSPNIINPILRFSAYHPYIKTKTVVLKNSSFLPLKIVWTTFVIPWGDKRHVHLDLPKISGPDFGIALETHPEKETDFCNIHLTNYMGKQESTVYRVNPTIVTIPPYGKAPLEITADTTRCWYSEDRMESLVHGTAFGVVYVDDESRNALCSDKKTYNEYVACYRPDGFEIEQITLRLESKVEICSIRILNVSQEGSIFYVSTSEVFCNEPYRQTKTFILKNFGDYKTFFNLCVQYPFEISCIRDNEKGEMQIGKEYSVESNEIVEVDITLKMNSTTMFEVCEKSCTYLDSKEPLKRKLVWKQRDFAEHVFALYLNILKPAIKISNTEIDFGIVDLYSKVTRTISIVSYHADEPYYVHYKLQKDEKIFKINEMRGVFRAKKEAFMDITFTPRDCTRYVVVIEFVTTTPGYVVPLVLIGTGRIDQRSNINCE